MFLFRLELEDGDLEEIDEELERDKVCYFFPTCMPYTYTVYL
jgi:hypothetical protein